MQQSSEWIPGLRSPSASERGWIRQMWLPEVQRRRFGSDGKIGRYAGIFLVAVCAIGMARGDVGVAGLIATLLLAVACFGFSLLSKQGKKHRQVLLQSLEQGNYQVAPAFSVWIGFANARNSYTKALAKVCLADGKGLEGVYDMPRRCAEPLIRQGIHRISILLIRIEGYPLLLTIPQQ